MANIVIWIVVTAILAGLIFLLQKAKIKASTDVPNGGKFTGARKFLSSIALPAQAVMVLLMLLHMASTSLFYVGDLETGHIVKRISKQGELEQGQIIATKGEAGPQAKIYGPGLHFSPLISLYADIELLPAIDIPAGYYGVVTALDGRKLPEDAVIASPLPGTSIAPSAAVEGGSKVSNLFDAEKFLDPENGGYQGLQATVLKPGMHRLNLYLFNVRMIGPDGNGIAYSREGKTSLKSRPEAATTITQIPTGFVGVVKSNIQEDWRTNELCRRGQKEASLGEIQSVLVPDGCKGVWSTTFEPGAYFFNSSVYEVTMVESRAVRWSYKGGYSRCKINLTVDAQGQFSQERVCTPEQFDPQQHADKAITVKVEGWDIPVELRVLMQVRPEDAPSVVAAVGSISEIEDRIITPAIRSIVRNVGGGIYQAPRLDEDGRVILDENGNPEIIRRPARALDFQDHRAYLEAAFERVIMTEARKAGISILEVKIGEPSIPPELLVARRREQLSEQLERSFEREKEAQTTRIEAENAKARADQQDKLVQAQIDLEASEQRKQARNNDGEGEKNFLLQVSEGQRAQTDVLGAENVLLLQALDMALKTLAENPQLTDLVPDPQVLVMGGGGAENATAIGAGLISEHLGKMLKGAAQ